MDFILNEGIEEDDEFKLVFSDNSEEEFSEEQELNFIDDDEGEEQEDASFYRSVDNNECVIFSNETKNPDDVVKESEDEYYGEDDMPELFDPENREDIEFDSFDNYSDKSQIFKNNSLLRFADVDNQFFYAVLYGIMHCKLSGRSVELQFAERVLGTEFFFELKKIEKSTMLDHSSFGFVDQCQVINEVFSKYGFFLRFYERRNNCQYQLRRKLKEKNQMKQELSARIIQKFNGYEILRNHLNSIERKDFIPIDVVYEPTLNENKIIECFFAPKIHLGFRTTIEKSRKCGNVLNHTHAKQCHYCNNYFIKSDEKMKKHLSICSGKAGFTFSFDNGKIVDYQGHYRDSGNLPFSICYDFKTTTGSVVFFDAKMYVVSYCMVVAFHPDLRILRLMIF